MRDFEYTPKFTETNIGILGRVYRDGYLYQNTKDEPFTINISTLYLNSYVTGELGICFGMEVSFS